MHRIVFDDPYEFVPPHRGNVWPWLIRLNLKRVLRNSYGIVEIEYRHVERLQASLSAGHGIVLAPNHSRPCDPLLLGLMARQAKTNLFAMASWSVFKQGRLQAFIARRLGAFSVYREGMDRAALNCAIEILETAQRPLVLFPEGVISRANDRLGQLMDGTAFIARNAAKKRAKQSPAGRVVVHPVGLKYQFLGDIDASVTPVLDDIETRLTWQPCREMPLYDRIRKIGSALISLKEIEYIGQPQPGSLHERVGRLVDCLLAPIEKEWLKGPQTGDVVGRVKKLRTAILPEMVDGDISNDERDRRWRQLADLYLAQQLWFYPSDYVHPDGPPERLLETVERFEEDLTDAARPHAPIKAVLEVGEAIEVSPQRERGAAADPLMVDLEAALKSMLESLGRELTGSPPSRNAEDERVLV
ncbi:MAG: 1-acyl-sn-glycerol-3-phosphate acyltransferase [Planctomycetaceae bacterium]|nr:1-acyl-sn-glycerol-3-phosphate acyltransferase [Planctomycetaceae bacterium]